MSELRDAIAVLTKAQAKLKKLAEKALRDHRFGDVADIAAIADRLADLILQVRQTQQSEMEAVHPRSAAQPQPAPGSDLAINLAPRAGRPRVYPCFEREGDRLIKMGWSKRDRRAYEHRAPRDAVFVFASRLAARAGGGRSFTMDELLPLTDEQGREIPSYQAYLALAWLRNAGVVERRGKDGYLLRNGTLESAQLTQLWNSTPVR